MDITTARNANYVHKFGTSGIRHHVIFEFGPSERSGSVSGPGLPTHYPKRHTGLVQLRDDFHYEQYDQNLASPHQLSSWLLLIPVPFFALMTA